MSVIRLPRGSFLASAIVAILVLVGYALAIAASSAPQCCDAMAYQDEARSIVAGTPQLLWVHNYGYAAFLALLQVAGLGDRVGVMIAQTTLLYVAVFATALAISRSTHASVPVAMVPLAAVALVPASAWSGYTLSEGLAAPVLMLVFGLTILATFRLLSAGWQLDRSSIGLAFALGFLGGMAWMIRPALVWIPMVTGIIVIGLSVSAARRRSLSALAIPAVMAAATLMVVAPQLALSDPFKLDLARGQAGGGGVNFRYATDVTSCGPPMLVFSPLTEEGVDLPTALTLAPDDIEWRLTAAVAHVVSGWDARPSPTYIDSYADRKWLVLSAASGFAIMGCVTAIAILWRRRGALGRPRTAILGALALLLFVSQAVLAMTQTEFRFNLAGWLLAGCCLAVVSGLRWWSSERAAIFVLLGLLVSGVVLTMGQMTLMYSETWLRCVGWTH
jgi:hypothetical protein